MIGVVNGSNPVLGLFGVIVVIYFFYQIFSSGK